MKPIIRSVALSALFLALLTNPVEATSCDARISLLASGGAIISAVTDSRASAVVVSDANGLFLQRLALRRGSVTDWVSFPVYPGAHFSVAFVSKSGVALCIDAIDIPTAPADPGGGVGGVTEGESDEHSGE